MATPRRPVLPPARVFGFLARLRTARDFGLDEETVERIAVQFDPVRHDLDELDAALAAEIIERGLVRLPESL
jgi:hypothetical protein